MDQEQQNAAVVRQQDFECNGPVDADVELGAGRLDVQLMESGQSVAVRVEPDSAPASPWGAGVAGLLSWLGEQTGSIAPGELGAESVRQTRVDFDGQRLVVQTPRDLPLRTVPLVVSVTAPAGSSLAARSGSADVTVDGVAGRVEVDTGSGDIRAQRCGGAAEVRTGSGDVRIGSVVGALRARTGSGVIEVVSLEGTGTVHTGSGDLRLGAVSDDLTARTGSGDLTVADAAAGRLELTTGSGELRVGIHAGVLAELDVSSGSGAARSELPVGGPPAEGAAALRVRGRTGSGDALVTAAC